MYYAKIINRFGHMIALLNEKSSLVGLWFENQKYFPNIDKDVKWISLEDCDYKGDNSEISANLKVVYEKLASLQDQLLAFDQGDLEVFDLTLEPKGTDFQKIVWDILLSIPYGETTTYGEISKQVAHRLGKESMSAQAVGGAVGHNPISVIVPCHRVVGANGTLTGYAGGLDKKTALLLHEKRGHNE